MPAPATAAKLRQLLGHVPKMFQGEVPDVLGERVETDWLTFLRRFDEVVYPTLYAPRGIGRDMALLSWQLSYHLEELIEMKDLLRQAVAHRDEEDSL